MLLNRDEVVAALFCETDRAQRMQSSLSVIQIAIENGGQYSSGEEVYRVVDEIAKRITRLLRTYDSIGQLARDTLLLILPGCTGIHAAALAERLKTEIFGIPVCAEGTKSCLTACFGVVSSGGRSPFIVMRDAARTLHNARAAGPGTIECLSVEENAEPAALLIAKLPRQLLRQ